MKKTQSVNETPSVTRANLAWLRKHAKEKGLGALDLMPSIRAASYDTLRRWLSNATSMPHRREHRRALAAYRRRCEARS